ncbi:MAG: vitamin B12-dependent ribonucleotide reductase [bacterium]
MILNNLIKRYYTKELEKDKNKTVYNLFDWKKVNVSIKDIKTQKVIFEANDLEFPIHYSQRACDIIVSRYFRKAGVNNGFGYEKSMKEVVHRMVDFWVDAALEEGLISKNHKQVMYDELVYTLLNQMWAPNSPQWFNTGLAKSHGIKGKPQGHFYYDEVKGKVVESNDAYTRTQGSACFIISLNDSLLGPHSITDNLVTETRLFKQGSGTGSNFSVLRAKGEKLSGGGSSSGLMSFLRIPDANAGAIKSGGVTRRAAKMVTIDANHPEVLEYIDWKAREEDKVRALAKMGYSVDEAYETVSGQNANNSVRLTNDLMRKMLGEDNDCSFELKGRVDNSINKMIDANKIWNHFNEAGWKCGDPAPQWDDIINDWHTCPAGEDGVYGAEYNRINASNPCSEYHFLDDTACNLASINVLKLYDFDTGKIDLKGYLHLIALIQIVLEVTIYKGHFPTADIARKSFNFRTTGLGICNTGALNMAMALPYDSDEARTITSSLVGILTGYSYYVSSLMSNLVGPFPKYSLNKQFMLKVIRNHARVAGAIDTPFENISYRPLLINHDLLRKIGFLDISDTLRDVWNNALLYGEKYGYRNAQVSVIAPTGTISLAMDCATTAIEPFFSHVMYKKVTDGSVMEIVNPIIPKTLERLGYKKYEIKAIIDYVLRKDKVTKNGNTFKKLVDGKIEGAPYLKEEHLPIFDTASKCGKGKRFISPEGHVKSVAVITPLVSGAISKTVNVPQNTTVNDFKNTYELAWRLGCKCITIYRDGSKAIQPLNSANNAEENLEDMTYEELLELTKSLKNKQREANDKAQEIKDITDVPDGYKKAKCSNCGNEQLVPNGTCSLCLVCGNTTGCS